MSAKSDKSLLLPADRLDELLQAVRHRGYTVFGPREERGVIAIRELSSVTDLPVGMVDEQRPGYYRLSKKNERGYFQFNLGASSPKEQLFKPKQNLFTVTSEAGGFKTEPTPVEQRKLAFLAVRACEVAAIQVQDRVFLPKDASNERFYEAARQDGLLIGLNCTTHTESCFCTSMNTGPAQSEGVDITLTEVVDAESHYFIVEVGSSVGSDIVASLALQPASEAEVGQARARVAEVAKSLAGQLGDIDVKQLLRERLQSPQWHEVAERCMACANCTMVCPTCFCSRVDDTLSLAGDTSERVRSWDSCFHAEHSYLHGGSVRASTAARYRQWLTHKFSSWYDQFDTSGCVGCGRCITWCPVGIDVTVEIKALAKESGA